jgi:glycosyltransferase involved in cell wall biosynthesis
MKIIFLADDFPPASYGGAGISTQELAQAVATMQHEVIVITTCRAEAEAGVHTYGRLRVHQIYSDYPERWRAWRGVYNPPVLRRVRRILAQERPDAVHANNVHYHLSWAVIPLAKRYANRVVWTGRDVMAVCYGKLETARYLETLDPHVSWLDNLRQAGKRYNPARNIVIRHYLACADRRFAVSAALKEILTANGVKDVEVIHTGIDVGEWEPDADEVTAFKQRHGLLGKKIVLFGGRLAAGKAVVEAMQRLVRDEHDAVLLIMGRKESAAGIQAQSADLPIVYTGWLEGAEKVTAYAAADIVWTPSTYFDAFPRMVLEAMAAGRPVIATKYGGAKEAVEDGVTGYVVDPRNAEAIAEKSLALMNDAKRLRAFGEAARERAQDTYSLGRYAERYLEAYRGERAGAATPRP